MHSWVYTCNATQWWQRWHRQYPMAHIYLQLQCIPIQEDKSTDKEMLIFIKRINIKREEKEQHTHTDKNKEENNKNCSSSSSSNFAVFADECLCVTLYLVILDRMKWNIVCTQWSNIRDQIFETHAESNKQVTIRQKSCTHTHTHGTKAKIKSHL